MDIIPFHLEIAALSTLIVCCYALKPRLGLGPMYLAVGVLLAQMVIGSRLVVLVPVLGGGEAFYTSLNHLALILGTMALVYALEGTREARRMILAVLVINGFLALLKVLLAQHLTQAGVDLTLYGRERWIDPRVWPVIVSTITFLVDGIVIIVVYQALLGGRLPQVVALSVALVGAMVVDGLLYGGLSGRLDWNAFGEHLLGKVTAGIAAAVPIATYIALQFRRTPEQLRNGVLHRGAFEIMDLRHQLTEVRQSLSKSRAEYDHAKTLFSRYVVPDVVDEILKDASKLKLGGQLREVTILFADIRGYSTLSEHLGPEQIIDLLNRYFGAMGEVISRERGTILEFEGDAILCVFGAPLDQPDHAARAVKTAVQMLERVVTLNFEWDADGTAQHWHDVELASFKIRIGLHTGEVVVGNIGSEAHTKYTVIGDAVNTASRIEQYNKVLGTTLLMSGSTAEQMGDLDLKLNDFGSHKLRGRKESVQLLSVWPLPGIKENPVARAALKEVEETDVGGDPD